MTNALKRKSQTEFLAVLVKLFAFAHDPADDWYRQPPGDEPRELTYVDEDTFWSEF